MGPVPVTLVRAKAWYKSRVIWLNILTLIVMILGGVTDAFHLTGPNAEWIAGTVSILNIILRFLSTRPVAASDDVHKEVV